MKTQIYALLIGGTLIACSPKEPPTSAQLYVTTADRSMELTPVDILSSDPITDTTNVITLDSSIIFQEMDGFGAAITGSSCYNLLKMPTEERAKLLKATFDPVEGDGYSYIRVSIGCSDFSVEDFTCCDKPGIENFTMHELDVRDLYPILKEILAINPSLKIMGSPWTCPKWMKVNNLKELKPFDSWTSGQLNPKYYADYATYFVKWIQTMEKKNLYFTEMSIGLWGDGYDFGGDLMWNMREVCIGTINRWCKGIIMWNFMLDDKHSPFRPGGCNICLGCIDINSQNYTGITKNSHYFTMAHLSKVVKPGAKRIESKGNVSQDLHYCAFLNPDNTFAAVLQNDTDQIMPVSFTDGVKVFHYELPARSVVSARWK